MRAKRASPPQELAGRGRPTAGRLQLVYQKKQRWLRSPAQLIKESKESNTFDCFDFLSSGTGTSIFPNVGLSVGPWKKLKIK